jgi:hypothetical protein
MMRETCERQMANGKWRNAKSLIPFVIMFLFALCPLPFALCPLYAAWPGVDETVVEKFAQERGREAHEPIINTDQGDLLLFVFLLAGAVGGFAAGYYWRMLLEGKEKKSPI